MILENISGIYRLWVLELTSYAAPVFDANTWRELEFTLYSASLVERTQPTPNGEVISRTVELSVPQKSIAFEAVLTRLAAAPLALRVEYFNRDTAQTLGNLDYPFALSWAHESGDDPAASSQFYRLTFSQAQPCQ